MDFGKAQELLLAGKRVARASWPSSAYMEPHVLQEGQHVPFHKVVDGKHVQWLGIDSHSDAGKNDWIQVGE